MMVRAMPWSWRCLALACTLALTGCGSGKPPVPSWQLEAVGALERYQQAFLTGASRAAQAEFRRARQALAATGQATLVARAELTRCALQVASLEFQPCTGFEALRADAAAPEQVYADYLAAAPLTAPKVALLPSWHRQVAGGASQTTALEAIEEPLARLVAAGVLLRAGQASPRTLQIAVDTASQQGWRRPLLAWLGAQALRAERAGAIEEAQRLRRRMALVGADETARPSP